MVDYMDRKRCFSMYFYTRSECHDCPKLKECREQNYNKNKASV